MSQSQAFLAQILDAAGVDALHEHFGLAAGSPIASDVGGLELVQKIWEAAKGLLGQLSLPALDETTIGALKAALNLALDKAFLVIDWPVVPDAPVDAFIRMLVNRWFDNAVKAKQSGS